MKIYLNNKMSKLYERLCNIIKNDENKFSILKKNNNYDFQKLKIVIKLLGKFGDIIVEARDL